MTSSYVDPSTHKTSQPFLTGAECFPAQTFLQKLSQQTGAHSNPPRTAPLWLDCSHFPPTKWEWWAWMRQEAPRHHGPQHARWKEVGRRSRELIELKSPVISHACVVLTDTQINEATIWDSLVIMSPFNWILEWNFTINLIADHFPFFSPWFCKQQRFLAELKKNNLGFVSSSKEKKGRNENSAWGRGTSLMYLNFK